MASSSPRRALLFVYLLLAAAVAVAGQYRFDTWTTDNGLPQNGVRQITQTPDGYLWFTTYDGLVRFDGVRFKTFNIGNTPGIINNRFTSIFADTDGTIYAATTEDGNVTVVRGGVFTSYGSDEVPGHYIQVIERGPDGRVRFLSEDDDRAGKTWYSLDSDGFHFIEKAPQPSDGIEMKGPDGAEWRIEKDGVIERRNGSSIKIKLDLGRLVYTPSRFFDREGNLWLGEERVYRIKNGAVEVFDEDDGLPITTVYHSFWQEEDGSVWFSSGGGSSSGIGLVQVRNGSVKIWDRDIRGFSVASAFVDHEGTAWLATTRGLVRRRRQIIESIAPKDGDKGNEIYPIFRDSSGTVWVGSTVGLSIVKDGFLHPVPIEPEDSGVDVSKRWLPGRMSVQSIWEDKKGQLWVGINGGLFIVRNRQAKMIYQGGHFFALHGDQSGNVWAATNKGLVRFRDEVPVAEYKTTDGLPNEFMTVIFEDSKGTMWFGGYGGLSRLVDGRFDNLTAADGLVGDHVRTIFEDSEGVMWVGTYDQGLSRYKDGKFSNFEQKDGLFSSGAFAIEEDGFGSFWITSNQGIYRVRKKELDDFAEGRVSKISSISYGRSDGMLSSECNGGRQPASYRDDQGRFWFPTQMGIAIVDPSAERPNPFAPPVVFEEVRADRQSAPLAESVLLAPGVRDLEIQYTGISLIKSDQIRFQYKLEGHDEEWVDAGSRRAAFYSYIPPGRYSFLVRAVNSDGVWSDPTAIKIELQPFFYQTKLFIVSCVLIGTLLLLGVWKLSVYQLRSRERRLALLIEERTAELARVNQHLETLANSDGLTKIGNRRRFESFLSDEWHRAVRFRTEISLVMIDIDHFKQFNDTYGHQAGDECLQKVAEAFAEAIKRPTDLVARFGGEEFALVLGGTDSDGAVKIAQEGLENLGRLEIKHSSSPISDMLTVSMGVATVLPRMGSTEADLIKAADEALYQAKKNGRNRIEIFDEMSHGPANAIRATKELFNVLN